MNRLLPRPGLFDTVRTGEIVTRKFWWHRISCPHAHSTRFVRVDHRAGPGSDADNYAGVVCCECGQVLEEHEWRWSDRTWLDGEPAQ